MFNQDLLVVTSLALTMLHICACDTCVSAGGSGKFALNLCELDTVAAVCHDNAIVVHCPVMNNGCQPRAGVTEASLSLPGRPLLSNSTRAGMLR